MKVSLHHINGNPKTNQENCSFIGEEEEEIKQRREIQVTRF